MNAIAAWIRLDLRGRARSLAVLALLIALVTGTVLTAVTGARRGGSAVDRLLDRTLPATIAVLPNEAGFDWEVVRAIPGVADISRFVVMSVELEGLPLEAADFPYVDDSIMRTVERPVVLEGRRADPSRADEAVVTQGFVDNHDLGVGDTATVRLLTPEQVDETYDVAAVAPPAEGPRVEVQIVGVVRSPWFGDADGTAGRLITTPALFAEHEANFMGRAETAHVNALLRLDGGQAAIPEFRARLAAVSGRTDIEFFDLPHEAQHVRDVTGFEANGLVAFAVAAGAAAVFLVGQSVARYSAGALADLQVMRAFGMTPSERRVAAAAGPTAAAIAGTLLGSAAAVVLSGRFPIGTAALFEPSPGRRVDVPVLVTGLIGVPVLVAAGALAVAWLASRERRPAEAARPSVVAAASARLGAPVPVTVGAQFALEPGRGAQAVPVRPALLGAVVGVLGVVAALTFARGVDDATANPARFGQVFELQAFLGFNGSDFLPSEDLLAIVADDPDVVAVNDSRQAVAEVGSESVAVYTLDPVGDPLAVVVTDGRLPEGGDEVALAPSTAQALDVGAGATIELTGTASSRTMTVTGIALVPDGSHNDYATGGWIPRDTYDELFDGFKFHTADIALRPGADAATVTERIGRAAAAVLGGPEAAGDVLVPPAPPTQQAELLQVRRMPVFLAVFLTVLAFGAVGHALATAVRRRRRDIAVLRAVGMTGWQCRAMVVTQATLLALFGLAIGVPTGFALGRVLWRSVADSTPLDYVPPVAAWALILIAPVALLAVNLLAVWPSQRAASIRVGHVLRTE